MPSPLEMYLTTIEPRYIPIVQMLDQAVLQAFPDFDVAIKYQMLTYTIGADYRNWICAIGVTKKAVCLRFLYGTLLDDPRGVLRAGTSTLKTLDISLLEELDVSLVTAYVAEAVARYDAFKAEANQKKAVDR